jgi:aldehyde dehydrogenase (NAD+)
MTTIANQFGMQEALEKLGIQAENLGTSTGNEWF